MTIRSNVRRFDHRYRFYVDVADFSRLAFTTCSEIAAEVGDVEHYEGGSMIAYKEPGRLTFPDITLTRGATTDRDLYDWFLLVADAAADAGDVIPSFKRDMDVVQMDRPGNVVKVWSVVNAWPKRFVAGEWSNEDDGVVIEQLVLRYDFFRRPED